MTVKELMERVGIRETGKAVAYIKDGLEELNMLTETHTRLERFDITQNQRFYNLPNDSLKIMDIRCKNQNNSDDEYRGIPRSINPPPTEDADGV